MGRTPTDIFNENPKLDGRIYKIYDVIFTKNLAELPGSLESSRHITPEGYSIYGDWIISKAGYKFVIKHLERIKKSARKTL